MEKQEIRTFKMATELGFDRVVKTFGRRHGKTISLRQRYLVDNLLPVISPKNDEKAGNLILEIGFGAGEHLRELAIQNPDSIIIGAEPFINGVASLLSAITEIEESRTKSESIESIIKPEYKNIRIWPDDVREYLRSSIFTFQSIYILHPDPWPKARHEKRRLLSSEFLNLLAKKLAPAGQIIIGTDHHEYYDWVCDQLNKTNLKIKSTDFEIAETRYQQKNMAGTDAPKYLVLSWT